MKLQNLNQLQKEDEMTLGDDWHTGTHKYARRPDACKRYKNHEIPHGQIVTEEKFPVLWNREAHAILGNFRQDLLYAFCNRCGQPLCVRGYGWEETTREEIAEEYAKYRVGLIIRARRSLEEMREISENRWNLPHLRPYPGSGTNAAKDCTSATQAPVSSRTPI